MRKKAASEAARLHPKTVHSAFMARKTNFVAATFMYLKSPLSGVKELIAGPSSPLLCHCKSTNLFILNAHEKFYASGFHAAPG
jgi:hypothetical protein